MLTNSAGTQAVSSLGWVDKGAVWMWTTERWPLKIVLSDAKWLSLVQGTDDYFAAVHHRDGKRLEITAHSHAEIANVVSRLSIEFKKSGQPQLTWEGDRSAWRNLPHAFVGYLSDDYRLVFLNGQGEVDIQTFDWFDDSYDRGQQRITSVTEVPNSDLLVVSVQRDSSPVLYDPLSKRVVRKLRLAEKGGNPEFTYRAVANEFWASDYDSMVKLRADTLEPIQSVVLQASVCGTRPFMGGSAFNADENLVLVARPFAGDAVVLDADSMQKVDRIELGRQPFDLGLLSDGIVVARDWKTGDFLSSRLRH